MSYILDALRRADSERERGAVPSLHSKPVPPALDADEDGTATARRRPLLWAAMGGLAVLGAVAVGMWLGRGERQAEPVTVAVAPAPALPGPPPPQVQPPAAPPVQATPPLPVPPAQPVAAKPVPVAAAPAPRSAERLPPPKPSARASAAPPAETEAEAPVPSMAALPEDIRRQLPPLSVSGATYSKNASNRMLILNGQIFHEGDKVANDLVLEQIRLKSAVFSFKGHRYGVNF